MDRAYFRMIEKGASGGTERGLYSLLDKINFGIWFQNGQILNYFRGKIPTKTNVSIRPIIILFFAQFAVCDVSYMAPNGTRVGVRTASYSHIASWLLHLFIYSETGELLLSVIKLRHSIQSNTDVSSMDLELELKNLITATNQKSYVLSI